MRVKGVQKITVAALAALVALAVVVYMTNKLHQDSEYLKQYDYAVTEQIGQSDFESRWCHPNYLPPPGYILYQQGIYQLQNQTRMDSDRDLLNQLNNDKELLNRSRRGQGRSS